MGLRHLDGVDVVEQVDTLPFGLAEHVGDERVLVDDDLLVDRLHLVDRSVGLQPLGVQPAEVDHQQLLDLGRGEARLALGRQPVGHEVDRLVELVDGARCDGVEAVRLTADRAGRDRERGDRRQDREDDRGARPCAADASDRPCEDALSHPAARISRIPRRRCLTSCSNVCTIESTDFPSAPSADPEPQSELPVRVGGFVSDPSIRTTIEELLAVEPAACDRDGLARVVRLTERARSWLAAVEVQVAKRGRELAASGTSESSEEMLSDRGRRSGKDARAADARAEVCEALPGFADALADGSVSTGHVDASPTRPATSTRKPASNSLSARPSSSDWRRR